MNPTIIGEKMAPQMLTPPINDIIEPAKFGDKSKLFIINPAFIDALIPMANVIKHNASVMLSEAYLKQNISTAGIVMPIVVNIFLDIARVSPRLRRILATLLNTTVINNSKICGNAEKKAF